MRKILGAAALALALCVPAVAGDIPNPVGSPQPPARMTAEETTADGYIQNELTETVLSLLESVLALF